MADENSEAGPSDWQNLRRDLAIRTKEPLSNAAFVFFTIISVIIFGGLGIWTEIVKIILASGHEVELNNLITAINTFIPALVGSAALQLTLAAVAKSDKPLIAFAFFMFSVFIVATALLSVFSSHAAKAVLWTATGFSLLAIWFWWITNGTDPLYKKSPSPDAATGGPIGKGLSGSLDGYAS